MQISWAQLEYGERRGLVKGMLSRAEIKGEIQNVTIVYRCPFLQIVVVVVVVVVGVMFSRNSSLKTPPWHIMGDP